MTLPLTGVTVLDLSQIYAGPYCTFLMAMAGATVIKIEPPKTGENLRFRSRTRDSDPLPFVMLNRNKRGVGLNLKDARGRELLLALAKRADVLVENFAPGVMDRLRCGWTTMQETNPRLIYASSTGYGLSGPKRDLLAMDLTVQAMSGVISVTGFPDQPPVKAGPAFCDFSAGTHLYGGIMTALFERERTGVGRLVEVSMLEATLPALASNLAQWHASGGKAAPRTGNRHGTLAEAPYNVYAAKDGYLAIICVTDGHWSALCRCMDRMELLTDPRFADRRLRGQNVYAVDDIVSAWTKGWTRDALVERLNAEGVPCAPVRDLAEVVDDPHLHERGSLTLTEHPGLGTTVQLGSAIRYHGDSEPAPAQSPRVGEHNRDVFGGMLGLSDAELDTLARDGVI